MLDKRYMRSAEAFMYSVGLITGGTPRSRR
ncbi:hypothetical protein AWB76_02289 [Caballeronia temeraria]|uniref:Uncharacterized protein n=1 Tax=Caballeronia temeraria TaxID=1777137 RepID=A0A158AFL9_9BURK|nr:hypothetical protein AWB76_02289 [Caballeronia temeraria]